MKKTVISLVATAGILLASPSLVIAQSTERGLLEQLLKEMRIMNKSLEKIASKQTTWAVIVPDGSPDSTLLRACEISGFKKVHTMPLGNGSTIVVCT